MLQGIENFEFKIGDIPVIFHILNTPLLFQHSLKGPRGIQRLEGQRLGFMQPGEQTVYN
ncbi:hypothetical protein D3C73_1659010 [compost metagenome]